ncbi:hypothetical protein LJC14_06865, partial [Treponema sp. OttesenSCG-928-L16]|nr:hypothetical protein [Treponema sp. OttesenSCG-928-L16]
MYKNLFFLLLLLFPFRIFAQNLSTLAICTFEVSGTSLKPEDAEQLTRQCINEISSWEAVTMLGEDQAEQADYVIRGTVSRNRNGISLSAATTDGKTGKSLTTVREQASSMEELSPKIFDFCLQLVQPIPFPNYLVGTWEASVSLNDAVLVCRLEFKSNRTLVVERYDTYEYNPGSVLKYEGYGTGTYTYIGRVRRSMAFRDSRGTVYWEGPVDASLSISFSLEDSLPAYSPFSSSRIYLVFGDARGSFELVSSGLPCGENNGGASVYSQKNISYTK